MSTLVKTIVASNEIIVIDLESVIVRKTDASQQGVYELDLEKLMKRTSDVKPFKLAQDDFVYVPKTKNAIANASRIHNGSIPTYWLNPLQTPATTLSSGSRYNLR